jgi:hypothetical protein
VLLAAEGRSNRDIGEVVDMHYNQVAVWRKRYAENRGRPVRPADTSVQEVGW